MLWWYPRSTWRCANRALRRRKLSWERERDGDIYIYIEREREVERERGVEPLCYLSLTFLSIHRCDDKILVLVFVRELTAGVWNVEFSLDDRLRIQDTDTGVEYSVEESITISMASRDEYVRKWIDLAVSSLWFSSHSLSYSLFPPLLSPPLSLPLHHSSPLSLSISTFIQTTASMKMSSSSRMHTSLEPTSEYQGRVRVETLHVAETATAS